MPKPLKTQDMEICSWRNRALKSLTCVCLFFFMWVFCHKHSQFTGQQGKWEAILLALFCHFHPVHRHLDISWTVTVESSPLHIASRQTQTGSL